MIEKANNERLFYNAPNHLVVDFILCGWIARPTYNGTHHGQYAVLCEWLCGCKPPNPKTHSEAGIRRGSG